MIGLPILKHARRHAVIDANMWVIVANRSGSRKFTSPWRASIRFVISRLRRKFAKFFTKECGNTELPTRSTRLPALCEEALPTALTIVRLRHCGVALIHVHGMTYPELTEKVASLLATLDRDLRRMREWLEAVAG
jgi:hypothetical protein